MDFHCVRSIAELCRREGISQGIYYKWSKDFMEAGKRRLDGTKHRWGEKTRYDYRKTMEQHLEDSDTAASRIGDVTRADLMRLLDAATDASPSGGALFYRVLSSFLGWADGPIAPTAPCSAAA